jgi:hypothetical protein
MTIHQDFNCRKLQTQDSKSTIKEKKNYVLKRVVVRWSGFFMTKPCHEQNIRQIDGELEVAVKFFKVPSKKWSFELN